MKRHTVLRSFVSLFLLTILSLPAVATNLTGTFKHPDGSLVNGKLIFLLSQPARLSDNSAQIVPMVKIFSVTNGALESGAFVYGNDVLVPSGTYYLVRLVDNNNNLLFEQKWSIQGTDLDLGTLTPTTSGVVVPDPLLRNVTTSQSVQGPVTFSSGVTAFSLTLNGNMNPGSADSYDLGSTSAPWREIVAQRWNGMFRPGTSTGTVTPPATAPVTAVDATSGGSIGNQTVYFKISLVNKTSAGGGETTLSPAQTLAISTCGGGACTVSITPAGQGWGTEWRTGAYGMRVWASSDNVNFYLQDGANTFTGGGLAKIHMVGDMILTTLTFSGNTPPSTNTATIDTDQVALNAAIAARGTLQYNAGNYTGTVPLIVPQRARIRGHALSGLDDTDQGTTRTCAFSDTHLGCVMVMEANGVDVEGLNIKSASHGLMLHKAVAAGFGNEIRYARATIEDTSTSGAMGNIFIKGKWFYMNFPELQLKKYCSTAVGGAGVLVSNPAGNRWKFSGPVRWTICDKSDFVRNDAGPVDFERGVNPPGFVAWGGMILEDVEFQSSTSGTGNGVYFKAVNLALELKRVTSADYSPAAGTGPLIQLGADANAVGGGGIWFRMEDSDLRGAANAASTIKVMSNAGSTFTEIKINGLILASGASSNAIDFNNLSVPRVVLHNPGEQTCNPNGTLARLINLPTTNATVQCIGGQVNNGLELSRHAQSRITGGSIWSSDGDSTKYRVWKWSASDDMTFYTGNPATTANRVFSFGTDKRTLFFKSDGSSVMFNIDARSGIDVLEAGAKLRPVTNDTALGESSLRWNGFFTTIAANNQITSTLTTGTAPLSIASTTEVTNLNVQQWHGKQAVDFSSALDFGSIAAQTCSELTITAAGATTTSPVAPSWPVSLEAGLTGIMYVSAADTVTVRLCNVTTGAVDPASRTYAGRVVK